MNLKGYETKNNKYISYIILLYGSTLKISENVRESS